MKKLRKPRVSAQIIFEAYRDSAHGWRWEMKTRNGRVVAAATEGYKNRMRALENMHLVTGVRWRIPRFWKGPHSLHISLPRGEY